MDGQIGECEALARSAEVFETAGHDLAKLISSLRQLADAAALRELALGSRTEITADAVRSIINARHLRQEYLGQRLGEPGWAILLELCAIRLEGRQIAMPQLGVAAGIPETAAHDCIRRLVERGLVARQSDSADERSAAIGLTDKAADLMRDYLKAALSLSPWIL